MNLDLPEIGEVLRNLEHIKNRIDQVSTKSDLTQTWYNINECHALKGGCSFNTLKSNYSLQPKGGVPDAKVGGRKVWHRDTVIEWLNVTDEELPNYLSKNVVSE